ncbi:hypothetical protein [Chryseobacterium sp. CCH4-E10]|uniref:hypothetical protein n=1 Tax=Chryseobacterium sp. CCH4-E10 TaxID=1768758 RepID=UPI000A7566C2|nr:hypothetical protein [Chryseobacterium sp. CCH4-E10]
MKKIILLLLTATSFILNGQSFESAIPGMNITAPTASSIANHIKSPSGLSTGIPDIGIPFFSLPTYHKSLSLNVGLSYHPNNTLMSSKASDVGLGWSVYGANNVIYREIQPWTSTPTDNYFFNFLGRSGQFQFFKNTTNGNLTLSKITEDYLQITPTETGTNSYQFKITDENGFKYYFDASDVSYSRDLNATFTACYYLTKVEDINGLELVSFEYLTDNYLSDGVSTRPVKSLKISKITSNNFGSINFSYTFNANDRKSYLDPYQLNTIEFKNKAGKQIEKYIIQSVVGSIDYPLGFIENALFNHCGIVESQGKRFLTKILRYGTGTGYETTEIKYPMFGNNFDVTDYWSQYPEVDTSNKCFREEFNNPKYMGIGLLQSIKYPNGTQVRYTFEPNQYYVDKSFPDYQILAPPHEVKDRDAQYFEDVAFIPFDFHYNQNQILNYTLPVNPDDSGGYSYLFYHVTVGELYTDSPFVPTNGNYFVEAQFSGGVNDAEGHKKYPAGNNSIVMSGTGGRGSVIIKRIRYKSFPVANYSTGMGVRIKKIEYLENNTPVETLTRRYEYGKFDGSSITSGFLNDIDNMQTVVYQNVKETEGQNKGYTKYYFKTLFDKSEVMPTLSPDLIPVNELRFVNLLSNGLLQKKEVFDKDNHLVQKDEITVNMVPITSSYVNLGIYNGHNFEAIRNGLILNQTTISKVFTPSGEFTQNSYLTRDINDYNVIYQKNTGTDGNITETNVTYPRTANPRLWDANLKTVPLITETKVNGTSTDKAEIKFDNTAHYYPTSQISILPDGSSATLKNVSFDLYDDKGNVIQYTTLPETGAAGIPTTFIYGYYKTLPIAKITGAKLSDIPASLINAIVAASDADANATPSQEASTEQQLIDALNNFRIDSSMSNFMVTCYTYNPLIGITNIIPPTGLMEIYEYDTFNRLKTVKNTNGNVLKSYEYNYKH